MHRNRNIRDRYRKIVRALVTEHKEEGSGYHVSKDATLSRCLKYTMDYIVRGEKKHYRYNRYDNSLKYYINKHPVKASTIVNVDLGCGPGLFSWVVADYFRSKSSINVELFGYDCAPQMVKLARLIWQQLGEGERYSCHHDLAKFMRLLQKLEASRVYILVTLGHVLIQTRDDDQAQADFAQVVATLAQLADCGIVAVDATSRCRPAMFREACDGLKTAMEKQELLVNNLHMVESSMWTVARAR